ncbi:MAG: hypothetical protein LBC92_05575 [Rickettsiales bacterium]|jgi:hypothetical protein|nr:hypothetical protein [Rickettsiales bacterium]
MQLVYFSSVTRLIIVIGFILFTCIYINNSIKNKEIEFLVVRLRARNRLILALWISFCLMGAFIIIPTMFVIFIYNGIFFKTLLWGLSLFFETMIIATFSIAASVIIQNNLISILDAGVFYFISRMMGFFTYSIDLSKNVSFINYVLKILSSFFPRIDLFTKSEWLIYGHDYKDIYIVTIQSLIYIFLLLFISIYDFNKKEI